MAIPTKVNIKQLTQLEEINDGDFLLVETNTGTKIIDFRNFVVGPNNVSWYNDFTALSAQVVALSASVDQAVSNISEQIDITTASSIDSLSATVNQQYRRSFYTAGTLTVIAGNITSDAVPIVVPETVSIGLEDININFNSTAVPANTAQYVNAVPIINGSTPNYALQVELTSTTVNNVTIGYNIFKPY